MLNHITIAGRLTKDVELRRTPAGVAVASFTVACERDFKEKDGEKETDFIECVAWRNTAEFVAKYFSKGKLAMVSGRLQIRKWKDKDGNNRSTAEIVADNVYFGGEKEKETSDYTGFVPNDKVPAAASFLPMDDDDAELPF